MCCSKSLLNCEAFARPNPKKSPLERSLLIRFESSFGVDSVSVQNRRQFAGDPVCPPLAVVVPSELRLDCTSCKSGALLSVLSSCGLRSGGSRQKKSISLRLSGAGLLLEMDMHLFLGRTTGDLHPVTTPSDLVEPQCDALHFRSDRGIGQWEGSAFIVDVCI